MTCRKSNRRSFSCEPATFLSCTLARTHVPELPCGHILEVSITPHEIKGPTVACGERRNVRRDAMKAVDALEKKGDLGEDEAKALSDTVQELTDDYVKQVARLALWHVLCVCLLSS